MQAVPKANQPIILAETQIVDIDGQTVQTPVRAVLRLSPRLGLNIESDDLPPLIFSKERFWISMANGARIEGSVGSYKLGGQIKGALVPVTQPCVVLDTERPLRSVELSILNFPEFFGQQDQWIEANETSHFRGAARLEAGPWTIMITAVPNLDEVRKTLKADGGRAVTHTGLITRSDGGTFCVTDASILLSGLRAFLSFARGVSCGIANVEGKDRSGELSWLRWGSEYVRTWRNAGSWLITVGGGDVLASVFPGFWQQFTKDESWQESVKRSIDWYLNSNESAMHVGIVLTQAALERLSFQILGRTRENNEPTGKFIREALGCLDLDARIPPSCPKLEELRRVNNWKDALHTLVKIRNDLVHPEKKLGTISLSAISQARSLGQWYIELMLLKLFDYQGSYWNRLTLELERVPWAEGDTKAK